MKQAMTRHSRGLPIATGIDRHAGATRTLLDELMPAFDFGNRHAIVVAAPRERVSEAIETSRLDSPVVRVLFRLRGLPSHPGTLRETFAREGFRILAEKPGEEVVVGVA